ncbi:MAG: response regulator [Anaerolineales bacterium]|nr:response regulator [Anaerolineales bacterium]
MPGEKILVIDDSREMRDLMVNYILRPNGYNTLMAENGADGLTLARQAAPDLIIADMKMPQMTGLELAQIVIREGLGIPVILVTAEGSEELAKLALRSGVADYLIKPFSEEELLGAVRRTLSAAQSRRETVRMQAELAAAHQTALQRLKELETLANIGREVTAVLDLDQVLSKVVEAAVNLTGAEEGSLLLQDETAHELTMRASKNFEDSFVRTFRLRSQDSLAGYVVRTGEAVLLDENSPQKIKTAYLVHSLVYVPLKVRERVIGVLGVDNRRAGRAFTRHDQRLLQALGDYAVIAIDNANLYARTERERAQLETILRETEDGVIVVDAQNHLILMNPTARTAFGVNSADIAGRDFAGVIRSQEVRELFQGKSRRTEVTLDDGRVFNAHLTPIADVGRAVVLQDITHLKKLDRIKSEFVTTVSHDLRSPLTAILGYVELLSRAGPINEQQAEFIRRVQYSVQSITSLITDLLDLGRIESGFDSQKEPTHLGLVVRYAVDGLRAQAENKHQTLTINVPENLPPVFANPPRMRQVLANLLDNAIKYTPDGGQVTVTARSDDGLILLTVTDSGMGIPPADQPYIFDKFYRASNSRQDFAGTGLGLSIVKSIVVNQHDGRIWVDSRPGEGTTFTVVLPQHDANGQAKPVPASAN